MISYWLLKSEPEVFSFNDLIRDGKTVWDGVRNYQARNNLKKMKIGDICLFYHSVTEKAVVGIMKVSKEYFQDPSDTTGKWVSIEVVPVKKLSHPVTLDMIKSIKSLSDIPLIKQSRLSVMPLSKIHHDLILDENFDKLK